MPVYKALILNKEINVNYEHDQKKQLEASIEKINSHLNKLGSLNGKISNTKLLSFLAIKLQAEIIELEDNKKKDQSFEKKLLDYKNENLNISNKLHKLREKYNLLERDKNLISKDLIEIQDQINLIISLIKNI